MKLEDVGAGNGRVGRRQGREDGGSEMPQRLGHDPVEHGVQLGDERIGGDAGMVREELLDLEAQRIDGFGEVERLGHRDLGVLADQRQGRRQVADLRDVARERRHRREARDEPVLDRAGQPGEVHVGVGQALDIVSGSRVERERAAVIAADVDAAAQLGRDRDRVARRRRRVAEGPEVQRVGAPGRGFHDGDSDAPVVVELERVVAGAARDRQLVVDVRAAQSSERDGVVTAAEIDCDRARRAGDGERRGLERRAGEHELRDRRLRQRRVGVPAPGQVEDDIAADARVADRLHAVVLDDGAVEINGSGVGTGPGVDPLRIPAVLDDDRVESARAAIDGAHAAARRHDEGVLIIRRTGQVLDAGKDDATEDAGADTADVPHGVETRTGEGVDAVAATERHPEGRRKAGVDGQPVGVVRSDDLDGTRLIERLPRDDLATTGTLLRDLHGLGSPVVDHAKRDVHRSRRLVDKRVQGRRVEQEPGFERLEHRSSGPAARPREASRMLRIEQFGQTHRRPSRIE